MGCETSREKTLQPTYGQHDFFFFPLKVLEFLQYFFCGPVKLAIINFLKTFEEVGR